MAKKTKCYLVRFQEFRRVTQKAFVAFGFDGSETVFPASQFYGYGDNNSPGESVYLSEWILKQKTIEYRRDNPVFLTDDGNNACTVPAGAAAIIEHIPEKLEPQTAKAAEIPFAESKNKAVFSSSCRVPAAVNLINSLENAGIVFWICPAEMKGTFEVLGCRYPVRFVDAESVRAGENEYYSAMQSIRCTPGAVVVADCCLNVERPGKPMETAHVNRFGMLGSAAEYRIMLCDKSPEKAVEDIYYQMRFLSPDIFPMNYYEYRERYCRYTQFKRSGKVEKTFIDGYANLEHLAATIAPYSYLAEKV